MVSPVGVAGAVVEASERCPVFIFQVREQAGVADKICKEKELVVLRPADFGYEVAAGVGTGKAPVEAADLEHAPESTFHCGHGVDAHGSGEACMLCRLSVTVAGIVRGREHFGVFGACGGEVYSSAPGRAAEHGKVEIYQRAAVAVKSGARRAGLYLHHGSYGRRLNTEPACYLAVVGIGKGAAVGNFHYRDKSPENGVAVGNEELALLHFEAVGAEVVERQSPGGGSLRGADSRCQS